MSLSPKESNVNIFSNIYRNSIWGDGTLIPKSGIGSLPHYAEFYVNFVEKIISDYEIKSVVDVGHGDWKMWRDKSFENVNYYGVDVADGLSEEVTSKFGNPKRVFKQVDGVFDVLPASDLLICKDVLQHLPNEQVTNFLAICQNYKYIVLSNDYVNFNFINVLKIIRSQINFVERIVNIKNLKSPFQKTYRIGNNYDILTGRGRGIDLEKEPFKQAYYKFHVIQKLDYWVGKKSITTNRIYFLQTKN
jgi:hypothetical protein